MRYAFTKLDKLRGRYFVWHPVAAAIECKKLGRFAHIRIEDMAAALHRAPHGHEASAELVRIWNDLPGWECDERYLPQMPGRWSESGAVERLLQKFGAFCRACREIKGSEDGEMASAWWWRSHEMCQACVVVAKKQGFRFLKEQKVAEIFSQHVSANGAERRARYEARAEKSRRRRRLEVAAYEMLSEMGLLEGVEV